MKHNFVARRRRRAVCSCLSLAVAATTIIITTSSRCPYNQWDQIWRNFTTLTKFKALAIFVLFILQKNKSTLANFLCYWAHFHC